MQALSPCSGLLNAAFAAAAAGATVSAATHVERALHVSYPLFLQCSGD
jgi:hypothetical protein